MANGIEAILEKILDTKVDIGRVEIRWNGRIVIDDIRVDDRQGESMFQVTRVGVRVNLNDLLQNRVRIGNAQLFGLQANLYQERPDTSANFQFILDAFASKDTSSQHPLDLRIGQLLVRRGHISWRQRWKKDSGVDIANLNLTAQLNCLTADSLNVHVKRFDGSEARGLIVKSLVFDLVGNRKGIRLTDFALALPGSKVEIPDAQYALTDKSYRGRILGHLDANDMVFALPRLAQVKEKAEIDIQFAGEHDDLRISHLRLHDEGGHLRLVTAGRINGFSKGKENIEAEVDIHQLAVTEQAVSPYFQHPLLQRLGTLGLKGRAEWKEATLHADVDALTMLGSFSVKGWGRTDGTIDADVATLGFSLGKLLDRKDLGNVALNLKASGRIDKRPDLDIQGKISEVDFRNYRYRNIELNGHAGDKVYRGSVEIGDLNLALNAAGEIDLNQSLYRLEADINRFAPAGLNLTKRYAGTSFAGRLQVDLQGKRFEDMTGTVFLNNFAMRDASDTYIPGDIHITSRLEGGGRNIMLISPFLEAQVEGEIRPQVLVSQIRRMVSQYLPTIQTAHEAYTPVGGEPISFILRAYNAEPLHRLLDIPLELPQPVVVHGEMDNGKNELWVNLTAPAVQYGTEELRDIDLKLESNYESLVASLQAQRMMKGRWVELGLHTEGREGRLHTRLSFDNCNQPSYAGEIHLTSHLWKDPEGRQGFDGRIQASDLIIGDTVWNVHPSALSYYNNVLRVDGFNVSQGDHFVRIDGHASQSSTDTLNVRFQRIDLEYIFSLINFHAVELTGEATGAAWAHSLFSSPHADARVRIPQFGLNYATMGDLDIALNWGQKPYAIKLDGNISNPQRDGQTQVAGYITPKKDISYHGLDLHIDARRVNLGFLNKWTAAIFDDLQGCATGKTHIFGPFKTINIEGGVLVNEASLGVQSIGVRYHIENDSVLLVPDTISFANARLYDPQGSPDREEHSAIVSGRLTHTHFSNLCYDVDIRGRNILGYDFQEFGDRTFHGTVYATGNITLSGQPGIVNIGIQAIPERGTTLTYNASSPDHLTETPFITYVNRRERLMHDTDDAPLGAGTAGAVPLPVTSDINIDFDLDIDNQSTLNLLMDSRAGDMITLNGHGRMQAHFYNKGAFRLYGTYTVEHGTYNLSLQDVIHKNFEFSNGGTLTFNGEPFAADLNLQAVHTVSGVSLNDINPKANFSNSSARVNCLMNIGGKAQAPRITFDFDIQNANEEEKQMVRSLISTEEERNMQVIYLLGFGRFYAYDYNNESQTQSAVAVNSLLSSTLSGTLNQALSTMLGTTNWNIGTNLRTGQTGWSDMDVEGILQGNLLNNRLLINGNFGYRDNPVATNNFIGDFDVKYLLTHSGSVALKAYSETNDRYFTKTSLTTQGVGILLKKDFTSWKDLMEIRKKRKAWNSLPNR